MTFRLNPTLQAPLIEMATHPKETGIVSDIDGTICPIAESPDKASVATETTELLARLASTFSVVALLSGRCVSDMFRLVPLEQLIMSGNHGLQWLCGGRASDAEEAAGYRATLEPLAEELRGRLGEDVIVEPKGLSISFHYRKSRNPAATRGRLLAQLEPLARTHSLRLLPGRMVIDLRPDCPLDKGSALEQLVRDNDLRHVLVLGDDATDAAAFRTLGELRRAGRVQGVSIGVTSEEVQDELWQTADYLVGEPDDVVGILSALIDLSSHSASKS